MSERLLIVAAHPDDEVLGCGATIAKARDAGHEVRVVFLAEGITARYDPPEFDRPDVVAQSERRNANAVRALAVLGVPADAVHLNTRPCCRLDQVPLIELTKQIEPHLREFRPTRVFTHWAHDANVDHRTAHAAMLAAMRPLAEHRPRAVLAFEVLSSTEWNPTQPFHANVFEDVTGFVARKVDALAAYEDEMRPAPHPRSPEALHALATYRGVQAGVAQAEAFNLIRGIDL